MTERFNDLIPIPPFPLSTPLHYYVPGFNACVKLNFFVDMGCPWCVVFWRDLWKQLEKEYFLDKENKPSDKKCGYGDLDVSFHLLALPYIPVSWDLLKALNFILLKKPNSLVEALDLFCAKEEEFRHGELKETNRKQLTEKLFKLFESLGIDHDEFTKQMLGFKNEVFNKAASMTKFAMSSGVYETPTMMINGVKVDGRWKMEDWKSTLDKVKQSYGKGFHLWSAETNSINKDFQ